ncbi:MAG TPA: DUF917 domain-containing protein [Thermomicrobiaceae bacterium]|nr:DUF917 domain-containing protein [Thermomicrobiaceae bacterium]
MATRTLDAADLWDISVGGGALATGGGGVGPTREQFDATVGPRLAQGDQPRLIDAADLPDDELVYLSAGVGGGVRREEKERWLANPGWGARSRPGFDQTAWINARLDELEELYPSCSWSERPGPDWHAVAEDRLRAALGRESFAYMPFEIGPRVYTTVLDAASKGKPTVDADLAGYRAVPEVSMASLNVHQARIGPVVLATAWGDLVVLEKVLNWQRLEDLSRHVAVSCGGGVGGMMAFPGAVVRAGAVAGTISKAMHVGRAIREATAAGRDPVAAAAEAAGGHVLFRGRVLAQLNEDKGSFIWGDERLEGTGDYAGHTFRVWYKNENHMSWLDGRPHVMSPDLVTVLDAATGHGLSNFAPGDWGYGREVGVIGVPCAPVWRTERGLRIFHPARWGFACEYRPIEDVVGS